MNLIQNCNIGIIIVQIQLTLKYILIYNNIIEQATKQQPSVQMMVDNLLASIISIFYHYMVSGVLQSGINQDGGIICYNQIPKLYHFSMMGLISILNIYLIWRLKDSLAQGWQYKQIQKQSQIKRIINIFCGFLGLLTLMIIFFYKIKTKKGLFIFNPCHVVLLVQSYLLLAPTNRFNKCVHTCWAAWLYGAVLALFFPHDNGVLEIERYLFYVQHILIIPFGPIILFQRYGFSNVTLNNHLASFSTNCAYQLMVLGPLSVKTMVNLNFILCHSPADPGYHIYGYHYFAYGVVVLGTFSVLTRLVIWFMFLIFKLCKMIKNENLKQKQF